MTAIVTKIVLSVLGTAGISLLSLAPASAVIFVEPIVTKENEDILQNKKPRELTPELQPGQVIEYGVPDVANNFKNATGRDIGSLVFKLETLFYSNQESTPTFNNEPVQWGDVNGDGKIGFSNTPGLEDIFKNITVTGDIITYSGGIIPDGSLFFNQFISQPDLRPGGGIIPKAPPPPADQDGPIRVSSYYTAIPEPTSVFGLLVLGSLGVASKMKLKFKGCKIES